MYNDDAIALGGSRKYFVNPFFWVLVTFTFLELATVKWTPPLHLFAARPAAQVTVMPTTPPPAVVQKPDRVEQALRLLELPEGKIGHYSKAIKDGAEVAKVDPVLIAVLMWTESRFNPKARNPRTGYCGLMQTRSATGIVHKDTMKGCEILREKMIVAKGNRHKALCFYKGSRYVKKKPGYTQATEVLELYRKIKRQIH